MFTKTLLAVLVATTAMAQAPKPASQPPKPAPPAAINPAKKALIDKLLLATSHAKEVAGSKDAMAQQFAQRARMSMPPSIPDTLVAKVTNDFRAELQKADFTGPIVRLYADTYSDQELQEITRFYESATGKKMLGAQPKFGEISFQMSQGVFNMAGKAAIEKNKVALEAASKAPAAPAKK